VDCLDQVVSTETLELEPEEAIYSIGDAEDVLSPADSASSSCSTSSDQYEEQNHNVKVVQLVGILPPGVKVFVTGLALFISFLASRNYIFMMTVSFLQAIQILQRDEDDDDTMQEDDSVDSSPAATCSPEEQTSFQELKLSGFYEFITNSMSIISLLKGFSILMDSLKCRRGKTIVDQGRSRVAHPLPSDQI